MYLTAHSLPPILAALLALLLLGGAPGAAAARYTLNSGEQEIILETHVLFSDASDQLILEWIEFTSAALASVYGRWPRDALHVRVLPGGLNTTDPVPWAQVHRGDPDTVSFYIDALANRRALIRNWTAYHEFSHLLIPYRGWGDMWFSEGLASYYQNLLQARHGVISEQEMWENLYAGFMRGRNKNRYSQLNLSQLSPKMHETGSYMRVYWSGAFYFLQADVELRRHSANRQSLDTALDALNRCCGQRQLSSREIARELDRVSEQELFTPLFDRIAASRAVPDFESLFRQLGIDIEGGRVKLRENHGEWQIRQGISRQTGLAAVY